MGLSWWQIVPPLALTISAGVLAVRYRRLQRGVAVTRRRLIREEERLVGSLALAEETVHRILLTSETGATLRRTAVHCAELLDLAGVRIELDASAVTGLAPDDAQVQHGSCEGANTQRLPLRVRDRQIGSFWFTPRIDRPLQIRELHFLRLMANLIGIGIENLLFHRQVRDATEDKARFILATTHDLRSPMTTIEQLASVLLDGYAGPLTEKQRDLVLKIRGRGEHQLQLISDLLNLASGLDGYPTPRESARVSLAALFDSQVEALRPACEAKEIVCEARRDEAPLERSAVRGDLENIFSNLFSNAVKYTPNGGRVTATLEAAAGECVLRVADTGIGIPAESLPHLFREYYRAPNARELTRHGTGLGLALVRQLVRKYDGRIRVESRLNEGTLVEVVLPVDDGRRTEGGPA